MQKSNKVSIVLSGGAIKGAFQVGVLKYINELNLDIELITGTSVGAINGALMAQNHFDKLYDIWTKEMVSTKAIYKNWPIPYIWGVFKGGLYNSSPLKKLIHKYVNTNTLIHSKTKFISCSTNLRTGEKVYTEANQKNRHIIKDQILASASFPIGFPPVVIDEYKHWDGAIKEPIPSKIAVEKAKETDKFIVIVASKTKVHSVPTLKKSLPHLIMRMTDLVFEEIFQNDLRIASSKYWNDKFILIEPPIVRFSHSFDVNSDKIKLAIEDGYKEAKKILKGKI